MYRDTRQLVPFRPAGAPWLLTLLSLLYASALPARGGGEEPLSAHVFLAGGSFDPLEMIDDPERERELEENILEAQRELLEDLDPEIGEGIRYLFRRQYTLWGRWTAEQLTALERNPRVQAVQIVPEMVYFDTEAHGLTGVDTVHELGFTGKGITMAIIDSAIEHDHPAFGGESSFPNSKILGGWDIADGDPDPTVDPGCSNPATDTAHGTSVAAVAAGNGGGITGVAPDAKIVFYKLDSKDACSGSALEGSPAAAIDLAVAERLIYGTKIISLSLGTTYPGVFDSPCSGFGGQKQAVDAANAAGMIVLAASGNEVACTGISAPACIEGAISVGSVADAPLTLTSPLCPSPKGCVCVRSNSCVAQVLGPEPSAMPGACAVSEVAVDVQPTLDRDRVMFYSNTAPILDLLGPGECARTAGMNGSTDTCFGGTSAATPFVAGVAATVLESFGGPNSLDGQQMRRMLYNSAADKYDWRVPGITSNGVYVKRRVDGAMAVLSPCVDCEGWTQESYAYIPGSPSYWPPVDNSFPFAGGSFHSSTGQIEGWLLQHDLPLHIRPFFELVLEEGQEVLPPTFPATYVWTPVTGGGNNLVSYSGAPGTYRWKVVSDATSPGLEFTLWSRH